MYYYNDLNSTEPQTIETTDLQLGLTKYRAIRAAVQNGLDTPLVAPRNVPNVRESEYGENIRCEDVWVESVVGLAAQSLSSSEWVLKRAKCCSSDVCCVYIVEPMIKNTLNIGHNRIHLHPKGHCLWSQMLVLYTYNTFVTSKSAFVTSIKRTKT